MYLRSGVALKLPRKHPQLMTIIRRPDTGCKGENVKKPRFFAGPAHLLRILALPRKPAKMFYALWRPVWYADRGRANKRRMSDLQEQLAELRQRIARVSVDCDRKMIARGGSAAL